MSKRSSIGPESIPSCEDDDGFSGMPSTREPLLLSEIVAAHKPWKGLRGGFMKWKSMDFFGRVTRWGNNNNFACALPTFHTETRPDGVHHQIIAIKRDAGYNSYWPTKDLRNYGAYKSCSLSMCWLECPSVKKLFHDVSWSASDPGSEIAAAHPTFRSYRGTIDDRIPHPEILYLKRSHALHSIFRATDIGSPDPNGPVEDIIRNVVDRGKTLEGYSAAYPDLDHAFDNRLGVSVFGVTLFRPHAAQLMWLPSREISTDATENVATITASFKNNYLSSTHWTVKDGTTNDVIIDREFAGKEEVSASLQAVRGYGEVYYKHSGQSIWTHEDFISNGELVTMP